MASPERPESWPDRSLPRAGARRIADVALRDLAPPGRARVHWPAPCADATAAPLVVLFASDDDLVGELIARLAAVVLTVSAAHAVEAHAVVSWAADHAAELGADATRIAVVGDRGGAALAERVAELAAGEGWPPLRHVALLWPHHDPTAGLDGLTHALSVENLPHPDRSAR
jgi:acetyl esterase